MEWYLTFSNGQIYECLKKKYKPEDNYLLFQVNIDIISFHFLRVKQVDG